MSETKPRRPTATDQMIQAAAEKVAAKMGGADAASIARQYRHPMDGFDLAKELDKWEYWDTTREDVDALDEMENLVDGALSEAEKQWAEQNSIAPTMAVGTRVRCPERNRIGVIDGVCEYGVARYLVAPEEPDEFERTHKARWIVKFEDAEPA